MADDEDTFGNPLSVEDDEYDVVHEVPLAVICHVPSLDDARATARQLIEHGLGATVSPVRDAAGGSGGFEVRVLPEEAARAAELLDLGGEPPGDGTGATPAEAAVDADAPAAAPAVPAEGGRPPVPWKLLVAIWLAAVILIPLVAFAGTYLLSR